MKAAGTFRICYSEKEMEQTSQCWDQAQRSSAVRAEGAVAGEDARDDAHRDDVPGQCPLQAGDKAPPCGMCLHHTRIPAHPAPTRVHIQQQAGTCTAWVAGGDVWMGQA